MDLHRIITKISNKVKKIKVHDIIYTMQHCLSVICYKHPEYIFLIPTN